MFKGSERYLLNESIFQKEPHLLSILHMVMYMFPRYSQFIAPSPSLTGSTKPLSMSASPLLQIDSSVPSFQIPYACANILCDTGGSIQCSVTTQRDEMGWEVGGSFSREGIYVYLWYIHFDVWQRPAQHCKAIILQEKKTYTTYTSVNNLYCRKKLFRQSILKKSDH